MTQVRQNEAGKIDNYFARLGGFDTLLASLVSTLAAQMTTIEGLWRNKLRKEESHYVVVVWVSCGG